MYLGVFSLRTIQLGDGQYKMAAESVFLQGGPSNALDLALQTRMHYEIWHPFWTDCDKRSVPYSPRLCLMAWGFKFGSVEGETSQGDQGEESSRR
jgi:hypothetical protein